MNNSSNKKSYLYITTFIKQTLKYKNDIKKSNHKSFEVALSLP